MEMVTLVANTSLVQNIIMVHNSNYSHLASTKKSKKFTPRVPPTNEEQTISMETNNAYRAYTAEDTAADYIYAEPSNVRENVYYNFGTTYDDITN